MSDLSKRITALSPKQYELLMRRLNREPGAAAVPRLAPQPRTSNVFPLSFAQQRLWFLDQIAPDSAAYHVSSALALRGRLDLAALQDSLDAVVRRHEILRTTFRLVDGQPAQAVGGPARLPLRVVELRALAADARAAQARRLASAEPQRPFDLAGSPAIRASLLRLSATEHVLILTMHHIISDQWSMAILLQEMTALYSARVAGQPAELPRLPIQYADYAVWQRRWLQGEVFGAQMAYWRARLGGADDHAGPLAQGGDMGPLAQGGDMGPLAQGGHRGPLAQGGHRGPLAQGGHRGPPLLPTDRPRPAVQTFHGALRTLMLPQPLSAALDALSRREGATLFMTLLAAFKVLLARYTGQTDLVVGTPIANRTRAETEHLIGFFVNTLVLRADLGGNPRFREALGRVREVALGAFAHQDLPFEQLVEAIQPQRDLSYTPLFQVMFAMQNVRIPAVELPRLVLQPLAIAVQTAKFDLTLELSDTPRGLAAALEYNTDLFDAATITRMLGHLRTLLGSIAADPDRRLAALRLLTAAEEQQLLVEWNDTRIGDREQGTGNRREQCVHKLFEAQAERAPDAIAIVFDETNDELTRDQGSGIRKQGDTAPIPDPRPLSPGPWHLTYAELNRRANQLAHHLHGLGVGPEAPVAVCVERSPELVVALLGVLKAGGAYVPLDPAYPAERLEFMLADSGARVIVTNDERRTTNEDSAPSSFVFRPSSFVNLQVVDLRSDWPAIARQPATSPDSGAAAAHLAYVIYTSGSTGTPKGVAVSHAGLLNLIAWHRRAYQVTAADRATQLASVAFDAFGWELWPYLAAGASVHLPDAALLGAPEQLRRWLIERAISICFLPTPVAEIALLQAWPRAGNLRYVLTGGDQLRRYPAAALPFVFLNHYGPTEVTVVTSVAKVSSGADQPGAPPIGRPIANTRVYLLDQHLNPALIGVPGELYIGGAQLARGYLNRPELTAAAFVPNPFAEVSGAGCRVLGTEPSDTRYPIPDTRLYRTGDLARYRPDGSLEFLGRLDGQVKLRGYRIELGEVEARLAQHPDVREAVVLAREDAPGDRRLVAYVVPTNDERRTTNDESSDSSFVVRRSSFVPELRTFLAARLPAYMLPAAFVLLDALPLTPNGKIDRRRLPAPDSARLAPEQTFTAPRTPAEELLAELWGELLRLERVGVYDNFFQLGGHSLLATQLMARVRETFHVDLALHQLFDAPTVAGLAERLASARGAGAGESVPPIIRAERAGPQPLSFAQQRLWFLDQLDPGSAVYTIPTAVRLLGRLDLAALEASLNGVVRRHASLRTTFAVVDGQPSQQVHPSTARRLPVVDLRALPEREREALARQLAQAAARRPFDLRNGPLLRALLLRVDDTTHVLILTMHHIISDAWSMGVLVQELSTLYAARRAGRGAALPELPVQYADYAIWQRRWLSGAVLEKHLDYWRRALAKEDGHAGPQQSGHVGPPLLDLPTDRPHPPGAAFEGARQALHMAPSLHAALTALSRQAGVTLFMILLAAFQTLLVRYTGQDDIVIGTPIANRTRLEIEPLIGFFVNTLVLRADLSGEPTFRELAKRVRMLTLDAYTHQDLPFERLVEKLQPERELNASPLFRVMFSMQNTPAPSLDLPGLALRPFPVTGGLAKFDLTLEMSETARGLSAAIEYKTALFDPPTIGRMLRHLQVVLEGCAAGPDAPISRVPLLTAAERQQLLHEWNDTRIGDREQGTGNRREQCVHELFETQASRAPDAIAVLYEDRQISYGELNARANQLAQHLRALGVGPDAIVALSVGRGIEMIVGILGIHKAGGAYLPIDPAYPAERRAYILEDSRARVLVTNDEVSDKETRRQGDNERINHLVSLSPCQLVKLDADWPGIARQPVTALDNRVGASNLAYVIYTSGSTGRPKGVMVVQRGLLNLCYGLRPFFDDPAVHATGLITSISFDISVNQIFPTLLFGRALHIIPDAIRYDNTALLPYVAARRIELLDGVPSYFQLVLQAPAPARIPATLRYLLIGGERIEPRLPQAIFDRLGPRVALVNIYGLTETSDINAFAVLGAAGRDASISVGRPLQNNQLSIMDRHRQPLPIGVVGEVYIAGESLSRGYLNRPELTAERFVPNPFAKVSGVGYRVSEDADPNTWHPTPDTRLCKTGDLGRRRADGRIEILGRADQQVKLHGYRIEVGEIEAALAQHAGVSECAVVPREDAPGEMRLVAYVVQASGVGDQGSGASRLPRDDEGRRTKDESPTVEDRRLKIEDSDAHVSASLSSILNPLSSDLRSFLKEHLPDYMLPSAFVPLDSLPRTPNGKIDRRALRQAGAPSGGAGYVAPRTLAEQLLAQIWSDLLRTASPGAHTNFFAVGGHSLLATQLVARVRQAFQVELPLRTIFEAPTIAGLAEYIERARGSRSSRLLSPIQPASREAPPPLSFAQQRLWFIDRLQPGQSAYHIPLAVRLTGGLDVAALTCSLNTIILRHEALRTTFATVDDQPVQVIAPALDLRLAVRDLRVLAAGRQAAEVQRYALAEAQQPFDLSRGPLLRATLLQLEPRAHILLLTLHHVVFDGWSITILIDEMIALYAALVSGQPAALPALPIQYADFAVWQRQWMQGAVLEAQLAYWRGQLAGAPPALDLPTDRPRPPIQANDGDVYTLELPPDLGDQLNHLSQRADATLFMTLLAAFQTLLLRYTGQSDIVVGAPIANRTRVEIEPLIGFFVNTLALRTDLAGDPTFQQLLMRVRDVCLGAYAHQDLPFEKLVEELQPRRDLSRQPIFQVMFNLQLALLPAQERADLTLAPVLMPQRAAKFDLSLAVSPHAQRLICDFEYNTTLFDATTIQRMARQFRTLVRAIVADPAGRLAALALLTAAERAQLLLEWNDTASGVRSQESGVSRAIDGACIHELIAAQAAHTPDAIALVFDAEMTKSDAQRAPGRTKDSLGDTFVVRRSSFVVHMTYRELDARANQLAQHLRARGVGPETLVAVCLERSLELVIALLGVLKAGGAYIPLDPSYPAERLQYMLDDSQAQVLITTNDERRTTNDENLAFVIRHSSFVNLAADWPAIAQMPDSILVNGTTADNLAYMIYTSGSTGAPKGAMNSHRGIANRLRWMRDAYALAPDDRVLQKTPYSFDVSVWEFFWPLMAGAALVVARPEGHKDAAYLARLIADQQISTLHFVPSMLAVFLEAEGLERCRALRQVLCSGEALPLALQQRFEARLGAALHNLYGPTEAAIDVTAWACARGALAGVPIGRPIANTQIYILDARMQPVPLGVAGELHIGGVQLARGYLGRPDLTAARFVPNPFAEVSGVGYRVLGVEPSDTRYPIPDTRLYKTGDLARYRADGAIEYLGRLDHQVKLRGFRIELGEIEAVLRRHPAVQECAVLARADETDDLRLVAYVVQESGVRSQESEGPASETLIPDLRSLIPELRAFLAERLPDYMLPAAFVLLDALPTTSNGKLDRRALPGPDLAQAARAGQYIAPRDTLEFQLVQLWESVLGVRPVGVADSFFSFGGHSLMAVRLMARIQREFGRSLPLAVLFQSPTVEQLARVLRQQTALPQRSPLVGIQPDGSKPPFFCIHPSSGSVLCYSELARHLGADQPLYGLQSVGLEGEAEPDARIEQMAARYVEALRAIQPQGPYHLGGWSMGGTVAFEMARQLHVCGQQVAQLILIDTVAYADALLMIDDTLLLIDLAQDLGLRLDEQDFSIDEFRRLALDQQLSYVLEQARKAQLLPLDLELAQIRRLFTVYKTNIHAMVSYSPRPYAGRITLLRASEPLPQLPPDPTLGWGARSVGVTIYTVPGNHFTLFKSPNVRHVAEQIAACFLKREA